MTVYFKALAHLVERYNKFYCKVEYSFNQIYTEIYLLCTDVTTILF